MFLLIHMLFTNPAPSTPRNLTLIVESNTTILVKWSPPQNENGIIGEYNIQVMEGVNSSWRDISVTGGENSKIVDQLKPYTYYTFRIQARTIRDWGNFSATKTERTLEGRTYTLQFYVILFELSIKLNYYISSVKAYSFYYLVG